jgi:hypothetical protein
LNNSFYETDVRYFFSYHLLKIINSAEFQLKYCVLDQEPHFSSPWLDRSTSPTLQYLCSFFLNHKAKWDAFPYRNSNRKIDQNSKRIMLPFFLTIGILDSRILMDSATIKRTHALQMFTDKWQMNQCLKVLFIHNDESKNEI